MTPEERLCILRDLDIEAFKALMLEEVGEAPATDEIALVAMHKARYHLAKIGHLERRYLIDSRRWLMMRDY